MVVSSTTLNFDLRIPVSAIGEDARLERRLVANALIGVQTTQHLFGLTDIPMLGELSVLNAPDIDCPIAEGFSSGCKAAKCTAVGRCMSGACDNLVTDNDAILYLHVMVGRYSEQVFEEFDLSGKARRTSPRVLNVGLCEELREGAGIMRVYGCNIPIEQRLSDRDSFGVARCFSGRTLERCQCCCAAD
jgi:hypothetical protein